MKTLLRNHGSADRRTSGTSGTCGTTNFLLKKKKINKIKAKNTLAVFKISFLGIKKIMLKEKCVFSLSTLLSSHRKPRFTQWAFVNMQVCSRWSKRWNERICMEFNNCALTFKRSELVLNKDKFTPPKHLFFCIVWISWAE